MFVYIFKLIKIIILNRIRNVRVFLFFILFYGDALLIDCGALSTKNLKKPSFIHPT